ncbi:hypothetical protein MUK51_07240 [Sphingobacterium faecium]|uniref:hypothetical protein n=1 Tax=Sphingobacterium faecium TaxID=34087 RepID=UPI0021B65EE3|nr:hypothetical protein [Sphingobacterium faecium]UXD71080.1 hypothetical protein MUK51_07240 [Sphingobacterium faecium]
MNSDITQLKLYNVMDSCSVWNILLSPTIYRASILAGCYYSFTNYVKYECLIKRRGTERENTSIDKLEKEIFDKRFTACNITIEDLQEIEILENRKKLGKGELSSIVFAKKAKLAFMTDDKKARKLGIEILGKEFVQTTPHLVGFCFYKRYLLDGDFGHLINEHTATLRGNWGDLSQFFELAYETSLRIQLMERKL